MADVATTKDVPRATDSSLDPAALLQRPSSRLPGIAKILPFFYGWFVVAVAMLAAFIGSGLNNVNMGVIFKPMSDDLGWSRSLMAGAVAGGTFVGGIFTPLAGRFADKFGPRVMMPLGAVLMGLLAIALAMVTEPWQFYLAYIPARAISHGMLIGVVPVTAVANWFYRQRPRAISLVTMAVPLGASVMALIYQFMINHHGWRSTFITLAILLLASSSCRPLSSCVASLKISVFFQMEPQSLSALKTGLGQTGP